MKQDVSGQIINNRKFLKIIAQTGDNKNVYQTECLLCGHIGRGTKQNVRQTKRCKKCSHPKKQDISGQVINNRKFLKRLENNYRGQSQYQIQCLLCNNIYIGNKGNVATSKRCIKCVRLLGPSNKRWRGGKYIPATYISIVKANAKIRDLDYKLSLKFLESLYIDQNKKCYYTNENIDFINKTASLDRIDSTKGYTKNNVCWAHKEVNKIKNKRSKQVFIKYCNQIHDYTHIIKETIIEPLYPLNIHKNFRGFGYISKNCFTTIKKGAEKRDLEFNITIEDMNNQFLQQGGVCKLTGCDLFFSKHIKSYGKNKRARGNASLDRIDNDKGYTIDNIQWLHKEVNMIKYTLSQDRLLEICKKIIKKHTKIIVISGFFQILHLGHLEYIKAAKKLGGYVIAIINSDKQAKNKNTPMINNENDRAYVINAMRGIDDTIISIDEDESVAKTLEMIKPDIFFNSGDRNLTNINKKEQKVCDKLGIKIIYGEQPKINSSSWIIDKFKIQSDI